MLLVLVLVLVILAVTVLLLLPRFQRTPIYVVGPTGQQGSAGLQGTPGKDGVTGAAGDLGATGPSAANIVDETQFITAFTFNTGGAQVPAVTFNVHKVGSVVTLMSVEDVLSSAAGNSGFLVSDDFLPAKYRPPNSGPLPTQAVPVMDQGASFYGTARVDRFVCQCSLHSHCIQYRSNHHRTRSESNRIRGRQY